MKGGLAAMMCAIHDRMPVVLPRADERRYAAEQDEHQHGDQRMEHEDRPPPEHIGDSAAKGRTHRLAGTDR
jgi:hypothetical protein